MRILGIDSGITGAVCLLTAGARHNNFPGVEFFDLPTYNNGTRNRIDIREMARMLDALKPTHAYIEEVWAQWGKGVAASGRMMETFGIVTAVTVLYCPANEVFPVAPQKWKRRFNVGADKELARATMIQLFPESAEPLKRKKDHNRAESGLIAVYGAERQGMLDLQG